MKLQFIYNYPSVVYISVHDFRMNVYVCTVFLATASMRVLSYTCICSFVVLILVKKPSQLRWDVAKALNMDYDKNKSMVDEICGALPNRDYDEDDSNPLHRILKAKGEKEYYLQKDMMGEFSKTNQYSQGFASTVNKNDKKTNVVEIVMNSGSDGQPKPPSSEVQLKEKLTVITSALPKIDKLLKDFKKVKAAIQFSKSPAGNLFLHNIFFRSVPLSRTLLTLNAFSVYEYNSSY